VERASDGVDGGTVKKVLACVQSIRPLADCSKSASAKFLDHNKIPVLSPMHIGVFGTAYKGMQQKQGQRHVKRPETNLQMSRVKHKQTKTIGRLPP